MKLKSSFTLALQTLTDEALDGMQRRNMRVNQWEDLVGWLSAEGLDCYAELIWGAPGDTPGSFLDGYDRLAEHVPRIAVYPLLLLPNTSYTEQREQHGFTTIRGERDDFEYVLANHDAGMPEHLRMQKFMYLARLLGENQYFKRLWKPARVLADMSQSQVILSLLDWLQESELPDVRQFRESFPVIAESPAVAAGHRMLYEHTDLDAEIERWWRQAIVARFPDQWREFGEQLYAFERLSRPVYQPSGYRVPDGWKLTHGCYVSKDVSFGYRFEETLSQLDTDPAADPLAEAVTYRFTSPEGFYNHLDNHETGAHYFAVPQIVPR